MKILIVDHTFSYENISNMQREKIYIYLVKIFIVQVLLGWLVTIHLRFVIGANKKYFVVIIDNTFIFQLQNISSMQREKNISVKVFIV